MTTPNTLVFGDDGSTNADRAFLWINAHRWSGWTLEIVHAVMPPLGPPPDPEDAVLHDWQPLHPRAVTAEADFSSVANLTGTIDPRLALWRPAALVVVGPRGTGLLKALHLGSTTEWLLAEPPAPVAVIRAATAVGLVVIAHDGSDDADAVTRVVAALPWIGGVTTTVLAVDDGRADTAGAIARAGAVLEACGVDANLVRDSGRPTDVIARHVEDLSPDLVAVGTRGLSPWPSRSLGSTANAIVRTATCSILVASARKPTPNAWSGAPH